MTPDGSVVRDLRPWRDLITIYQLLENNIDRLKCPVTILRDNARLLFGSDLHLATRITIGLASNKRDDSENTQDGENA
jgi:hypothetical protein